MKRRGEEGATAVIVVISLVALLGAATLAVDAGSVWRTRRDVITGTDAAALAAARYIDARGPHACDPAVQAGAQDEATRVLAQNDRLATLEGVTITPTGGRCTAQSGHVRVSARLNAKLTFAGVFGIADVPVLSSSTAQWGPLATLTGMRPIGICDAEPHFVEWTLHLAGNDTLWGKLPGDYVEPGTGAMIHRIDYGNNGTPCGTASGNWGWLDFNGTSSPNGDSALVSWLTGGFPGVISLGDPTTGIPRDCNPDLAGNQSACDPKTGATGSSFEPSLQFLRDNKVAFPIVVFDKVIDKRTQADCSAPPPWTGSGTNARYCLGAVLLVRLVAWNKPTGTSGSLDFEFLDEWWIGEIGVDPSAPLPTVHGVQLCGGNYGGVIDERCNV